MTDHTGMERSLAFTALLEVPEFRATESRAGSEIVTAFLDDYKSTMAINKWKIVAGKTDMVTAARVWAREYFDRLADKLYIPVRTTIERTHDRSPRAHAPYRLGFTVVHDEKSSSTNVEWLTQGELLTLWQQIGALFNLSGMRDGLTDADLEKMGVIRR